MHKLIGIATYAYTLLIVYLSLAKIILGILPKTIPYTDKWAHMLAYLGLSALWCLYIFYAKNYSATKVRVLLVFLVVVLFGAFMEFLQYSLTDYRSMDIYDVIANTIGSLCGVPLYHLVIKFLNKNEKL